MHAQIQECARDIGRKPETDPCIAHVWSISIAFGLMHAKPRRRSTDRPRPVNQRACVCAFHIVVISRSLLHPEYKHH